MTLHIGQSLEAERKGDEPVAERLLQLVNLPWYRTGQMPVWLRQRLTAGMTSSLYEQVRQILDGLLLTNVAPTRKNVAIDVGIGQAGATSKTAIEENRLSRQMRDPILLEFHMLFRQRRVAFRLPPIVARNLLRSGLLRNLFGRTSLDDLPSSAKILHHLVDRGEIVSVQVQNKTDVAAADRVGREGGIREVCGIVGASRVGIAPSYSYYLYLPASSAPVRLLDGATIALYRQRRSRAWRLSLINVGLMLLLGASLYGTAFDHANPGVAVILMLSWLVGPPAMVYVFHVYPVVQRFALFPAFQPVGDQPRIKSRDFIATNQAASPSAQTETGWIRVAPGVLIIALACLALYAGSTLPGLRGYSFGPGTMPYVVSIILLVLGLAVVVEGLMITRSMIPVTFTPVVGLIIAGAVFFVTIRPFGLIIAIGLASMITGIFYLRNRPGAIVRVVLVTVVFIVLFFVYLLNLPFQLWPRF